MKCGCGSRQLVGSDQSLAQTESAIVAWDLELGKNLELFGFELLLEFFGEVEILEGASAQADAIKRIFVTDAGSDRGEHVDESIMESSADDSRGRPGLQVME